MLEVALWSAVRALEEKMMLARRIEERARKANHRRVANLYERSAREAEEHSSVLRQLLLTEQKRESSDEVMQTGKN
jgi:two-component system chemotaxis response regulator CheB